MDVDALLDTSAYDAHHCDTHSDGKEFSCSWDDCSRSFARKSDLVRHYRIHTGVKPFECPWADCDKRFIQRSALKVHYRTHSGERPHTCEACDRSFSDSSSLARHRRTHTGVRPYGCDHQGCAKRFTRKTSLRKHMLTHGPGYAKRSRSSSVDEPELTSSSSPGADSRYYSSTPLASPLLSVGYLTTPPPPMSLKMLAPISSACHSGASTACCSPSMYGMEGTALPPISTLLR
ncbi:hypothetical protein GGI19_002673 [Coemansia pectinata]|uniref:C2H2-type domain-containing protein n=1 Tax=Coemansia pectinata TaxID=1052879 RepID=A0A9W8LBP0_9FUNG|nr:hypothetical protein GGI19_002673 [Coemansia pectinata]